MNNVMCYMNYDKCYVYVIVCCGQNVKYDDACNSHEMRLSGMSGMGLVIYPSLRTYTTNIGIWRGSIPMYASMFWVTLAGDSTSFHRGVS